MTFIGNIDILLIEDDVSLSNGVKLALQSPDNTIIQCFSIKEARQVDTASVSLIVLDINLPDGNGLDYLQELKIRYNVPIILLTANDMETDIVTGLELGADDYITKPFSYHSVSGREGWFARTIRTSVENKEFVGYQSERFMFNFQEMMYMVSEEQIELSKTEQKLLRMLIENKGITLERGVLIDRIWTDGAEYVDENALSVVIKRLRDKIEEVPTKPQYIKTVYGIGYKWEE